MLTGYLFQDISILNLPYFMAKKVRPTNYQAPTDPPQETASDPEKDLGFGTAISRNAKRLINPDGSLNIIRRGVGLSDIHPYHYLIGISWGRFWLIVGGFLFLFNLLFASIFVAIGIKQLSGLEVEEGVIGQLAYAFYFSVQTFTTVGYGAISPIGHAASFVASVEAAFGLIGFAFTTGILYGRFSRPTARIFFSEKALIAPYRGGQGLMFRIVNGRNNQLIELEVKVMLTWFKHATDTSRTYEQMKLERSRVSLFPLSWTIVHPIDEESPFYQKSPEQLAICNPEIMITIKGYDDTFAQEVHARSSYKAEDMVWNAKFEPMFFTDEEGDTILQLDKLSAYREV